MTLVDSLGVGEPWALLASCPLLAPVESLAYSHDGKTVASGSYQEVKLWDAKTGELTRTIGGFAERVVALAFSHDGKLLAYGLAAAGSDWQEWKGRDVATGADRDDHLEWIKVSGASWSGDDAGVYYSRHDETEPGGGLTGPD